MLAQLTRVSSLAPVGRLSFLLACVALISSTAAVAQERYELVAPQQGAYSRATLTASELRVEGTDGKVTQYIRQPRFDSAGGEWIGYASRDAQQVLRWPSSNSGNMQIGEINGNNVQYRYSQMTIRPVGQLPERIVDRPVLPPVSDPGLLPPNSTSLPPPLGSVEFGHGAGHIGNLASSDFFGQLLASRDPHRPVEPRALLIASSNGRSAPALLTRAAGFELGSTTDAGEASNWWVTPVGVGMVRVQTYDRGRVYAVSSQTSERVTLMPVTQDPRQLWRISGAGRADNRYVLESVRYPGLCLANLAGGLVAMQPINFAPTQLWVPLIPPPAPAFQPFYRTVRQEVHANPQLPPAQLELFNSHRNALTILLGDNRAGATVQQIRIAPGSSQVVSLDRDAGSSVIETIELLNALGAWERQQFVTTIPPSAIYDLSVYEEHLQSIAIDRTGKSPNQIEDVNVVPRSVGWLPLPPGTGLPSVSRLDVYSRAQAANNPGAVRRLDPRQFDDPPPANPLETILQELNAIPSAPSQTLTPPTQAQPPQFQPRAPQASPPAEPAPPSRSAKRRSF